MSRREPNEGVPLLVAGQHRRGAGRHTATTHSSSQVTRIRVEKENEIWDEDEDYEVMFSERKCRNTSLVVSDAILLILYFLQMLALMQALALRWAWPPGWLKTTKFIFLFNADIWEFMKLSKTGVYISVQGNFVDSTAVGINYSLILLLWGLFLFIALLAYIITYAILTYNKHPHMFVQVATLKRAYVIIAQIIAIPLGVALAKVFHCNDDSRVDVHNDLKCFENTHWAYLAPSLAVAILFYIFFPIWLIMKTKAEMLSMTPERHEGYLQLKETEYSHGLDVLWAVGGFHVFSSFKKHGAHYRAVLHIMTFVILIFYAALPHHMFAQALLINLIFMCIGVAYLIIRPYRVTCFNVMLFLTFLCLTVDAMMGSLVSYSSASDLKSIWMTPKYLNVILGIINIAWLVFAVLFVVYLILRHFATCWHCCCWKEPLWPSITSYGLGKLSHETRKFVIGILRGRVLVERVMAMPAIFAPAHELGRHIHVINAYCREAECLRDPMLEALWDLLDELIETHSMIAPKSLFAESVKDSIRLTAAEFMKIMPMFVRRLAQREYDFILMTPVKRRLLLKMYCMGLFLNGRRERVQRERLTVPAIQRVWGHQHTDVEEYHDDGYYEDMYPEAEEGPAFRPTTTVSLDMQVLMDQDIDDELALEEAEQWTKDHPINRQTYLNTAFVTEQDDLSDILRDDLSVDLTRMMEGVPSRPGTVPSLPGTPVQSRPGTAESRPSTARSTDSRLLTLAPPSGNTSRPSTAGSRPGSRPGSGHSTAKDDEAEQPSTPLPGQADDPANQNAGSSSPPAESQA